MNENKPYRKEYDKEGKVTNPITKETPYFSFFPNRRMRRDYGNRLWSRMRKGKK